MTKRLGVLLALLLLGGVAAAVAQIARAVGLGATGARVQGVSVDDQGAVGDGRTDDSAAFQAALDRCHATGGGKVLLSPKRYLIAATIHLTGGCVISAPFWPGLQQGGGDYSRLAYTIVLDPSATIDNASGYEENQGLENVFVIARGQYLAGPPTSYRAALTDIASYAGTAVTMVGGQDFLLRNVTMLGFATCVQIRYNQRPVLDHVYGDCTNGVIADSIYDVAKWRDLEMFPALLNYGNAMPKGTPGDLSLAVSGVTIIDGRYCLGVAASPYLVPATADTVYVTGIGGAVGANGKFTVTFGHAGCPGLWLTESMATSTAAAAVTQGDGWLKLAASPSAWAYWKGQIVTDRGGLIPPGAVIDRIWIGRAMIHVSKPPAGSLASDMLTITNPAATSGGVVHYTLGKRAGVAYQVTNATGVVCWNCFEYGYATGFHIGAGAVGVNFSGGGADNLNSLGDPTSVGVRIDGSAAAVQFIGHAVSSQGRAVVVDNAGSGNLAPNQFIGGQYATTTIPGGSFGASFELNSAWSSQVAHLAIAGDIEIANAVTAVQYAGIHGRSAEPVFEGATARGRTRQDGTSVFTAGAPTDIPLVEHTDQSWGRAASASAILRLGTSHVAGLALIDPVPATGDRAMVDDAAACVFAKPVTGGSSTRCPVVYDGFAWVGG